VNQIRNSHIVEGTAAAGFQDASLWEEARKKGDRAIKALVDENLKGTSVTVVLIGSETSERPYVDYEIEKSAEVGNGLLGIYVHNLKDQHGRMSTKGAVPAGLLKRQVPVYEWDRERFGQWVEVAAQKSQSQARPNFWQEWGATVGIVAGLVALWLIDRRGSSGSGGSW
jgi:hypothetical protein